MAVLIALAIALPLGLFIGHTDRLAFIVSAANTLRALPTVGVLVLLTVMISPNFHGRTDFGYLIPTEIVLVLIAIPPILSNTYAGVQNVDGAVRDAASAMGMTGSQVLRQVEFPCSLPLIFSGLRSASLAGHCDRNDRVLPPPWRPRQVHLRRARPTRLSADDRWRRACCAACTSHRFGARVHTATRCFPRRVRPLLEEGHDGERTSRCRHRRSGGRGSLTRSERTLTDVDAQRDPLNRRFYSSERPASASDIRSAVLHEAQGIDHRLAAGVAHRA